MGVTELNQMKQALIRQGIEPFKLEGLSEEQLRKLCDEKLYQSLTGNQNWGNTDSFAKQYKYNITYTLPSGEKIKVAKVADSKLPSGRKIETFIDIAGNQYFQYRASDSTILKEDYFRKQEKLGFAEHFKFMNGKLYKTDLLGNFTVVAEKETPKLKSVKQQLEEQKLKEHLDNLPKTDKSYNELKYEIESENMTRGEKLDAQLKLASEKFHKALDDGETGKAVGAFMKGIGLAFEQAFHTVDDRFGINRLKKFIRGHVPVMLPNGVVTTIDMDKALDTLAKWADDGDNTHLSLSESIVSATKAGVDVADSFVGSEMLCFMGVLGGIVKCAEGAKYAKLVSGTLLTLFTTMGITDEVVGVAELANAKTQAQAENAFNKIWNGLIVLGGTGYSYAKARTAQLTQQRADGVSGDGSGNLYSGFGFINELFGKKSTKVTETKPTETKISAPVAETPTKPRYDKYKLKIEETDNPTSINHLEAEDIGLSVSCGGYRSEIGMLSKIEAPDVREIPDVYSSKGGYYQACENPDVAIRYYDPEQNVTAVTYLRNDAGDNIDGVYIPGKISQADANAIMKIVRSKYCDFWNQTKRNMFELVDWKAVQAEVAEFLNRGGTSAVRSATPKPAATPTPRVAEPTRSMSVETERPSVAKPSEPTPPESVRKPEPYQKLEYGGNTSWQPKPTPKPVQSNGPFLNEAELKIVEQSIPNPKIRNAVKAAFEELGIRLRNGEKPSEDLLFTVSNFVSQKTGVGNGQIMGFMKTNIHKFGGKWSIIEYNQSAQMNDFWRTRE